MTAHNNHATAPSYRRERRSRAKVLEHAERRCYVPECRRRPKLVPMPMLDVRIWICDMHRGQRMVGAMTELVAHG